MKKVLIMGLTGIMALSFMVGCAPKEDKTQADISTKDNIVASTSDNALYPQLVIYKGTSYLITSNDSKVITQEMVGEKIGVTSGYIDFMGKVDEALLTKELANSINENAVFYKMNGYNDNFRILAEANGTYYICENIQISTEGMLEYKELIAKATINNNSMTKEYKEIGKEDMLNLIDIFAKTTKSELSNTEYETIAQAQVDGKSYHLNIIFEDGTSTKFIVIPELNLVSIGQEYHTSDSLKSDIAFVFDGLPLEADEIVH